jgi:hypothetical protein
MENKQSIAYVGEEGEVKTASLSTNKHSNTKKFTNKHAPFHRQNDDPTIN